MPEITQLKNKSIKSIIKEYKALISKTAERANKNSINHKVSWAKEEERKKQNNNGQENRVIFA